MWDLNLFSLEGTPWLIFGKVSLLLQIAFCIHVFRTGRPYWWMWIIMGFPGIGVGAYLFFEVLPEYRVGNFEDLLWLFKGPEGRLRVLRERVEESDTVQNRRALAAEFLKQGRNKEAVEILGECASGVFKDDAHILMEFAEALVGDSQWDRAKEVLANVKTKDRWLLYESRILEARCLAGNGQSAAADEIWKELEPRGLSEEPVYRLALSMLSAGDRVGGRRKLEEIRKRYRKGTVIWRRNQKQWFKLARQELKRSA